MSRQLSEEPPDLLLVEKVISLHSTHSIVGALLVEQVDVPLLGDRARLVPPIFASTVEEVARSIIRDAKACRMSWNETPSITASFAAGSKPGRVALLCPSGCPIPSL